MKKRHQKIKRGILPLILGLAGIAGTDQIFQSISDGGSTIEELLTKAIIAVVALLFALFGHGKAE